MEADQPALDVPEVWKSLGTRLSGAVCMFRGTVQQTGGYNMKTKEERLVKRTLRLVERGRREVQAFFWASVGPTKPHDEIRRAMRETRKGEAALKEATDGNN